ncbi:MAG: 2-amino-4-hydroxy-6-hydroxymethyldihydropteridine diphosphokinase [Pseudomonadota bacterium]
MFRNNNDLYHAFLGLGGNIGDPALSMASALQLLDEHRQIDVTAVSRLYRTPPWGKTDQDWFFNSCACVSTSLSPHDLLAVCLKTERRLKRIRRERWGPRIIDIDILTYDTAAVNDAQLTIPHPHMHERAFVLMPLMDISTGISVNDKGLAEWLLLAERSDIEIVSSDGSWWELGGADERRYSQD